jgi:2-hydroxy-3-oxopropionate reductase
VTDAIGFIGLGVMGQPMARHLLASGRPLIVHSRSPGPVEALVAAGARAAASPAEVARAARHLFTMLPDGPDVREVLDGDKGVLGAMAPGTIVVDSSTIAPATARELAARTAARGGTFLDAPVSGGEIGAVDGTLTFMVGGDVAALTAVRPWLALMGREDRIVHVGESGAGQICKACNQLVIGGTLAAVAEALALARKSGVDPGRVREALLGGFASSRVLEVHGERMIKANYVPGFKGRLYTKDLGIALDTLAAHGVPAPVTALVAQLVQAQVASGRGEDDYSAVAEVIFGLAGLKR